MVVCPVCKVDSVRKRLTWRGLLYGIACFPCGIYCCMKSRVWYCPLCTNEINYSDGSEPLFSRDYRCYRSFKNESHNGITNDQECSVPKNLTAASSERTTSTGRESISSTTPVLQQ